MKEGVFKLAVLSQEDFLARVRTLVGEDNTTDEALHNIEDFTDTYNSFSKDNSEDWKKKYDENDASWRKKYTDRFFASPEEIKKEQKEDIIEDGKEVTFNDLFEESEG